MKIWGQTKRDENAAQRPSSGHHQVELGQLPGGGFQANQLPVAHHADQKQDRQVDPRLHEQIVHELEQVHGEAVPREQALQIVFQQQDAQAEDSQAGQGRKNPSPVPDLPIEADDERQQIEAQGHDPEEGNDRHVLANVVRDGHQHDGCQGGKQQPQQPAIPGDLPGGEIRRLRPQRCRLRRNGLLSRRTARCDGQSAAAHGENPKQDRPGGPLRGRRHRRFHEERVREQRAEGADIREGVETVRGTPGSTRPNQT